MTRPQTSCCEPRQSRRPSGWAWDHARNCPKTPGQFIAYMTWDEGWFANRKLSAVATKPDPWTEKVRSIQLHADGDQCPAHGAFPKDDCPGCDEAVDRARGK